MDQLSLYDILLQQKVGPESFGLEAIVKGVTENKLKGTLRDILREASIFLGMRAEILSTPDVVLEFIKLFIDAARIEKLYIPFSTAADVEFLKDYVHQIYYKCLNHAYAVMAAHRTGIDPVEENQQEYSLVYSDLPFMGVYKDNIVTETVEENIKSLSADGYAIFTFPGNVTTNGHARKWLSKLQEKGLYISAVIDLPERLYPNTTISSKIVIFRKTEQEKVFLAKHKKEADISQIIEHYTSEKTTGQKPYLGIWINPEEYSDFTEYEKEQRRRRILEKLLKDYNGQKVCIGDIVEGMYSAKKGDVPFEDAENAIYIPKMGVSDTVTNPSEITIRPDNCIKVLVNQEKILPRFLTFLLNTEKGLEIRTSACSGGFIPSLNMEGLGSMEIPLPSLEDQEGILKTLDELNEIEQQVAQLKGKLESVPASYKNITKGIKDINNKGDKFEQWIETFPYPLATILKRYLISDHPQQKQEMLFYFFEAYSIFSAAILTAIYNQPEFGNLKIEDVDADKFEKASFGSWVKMDQAIASSFRREIAKAREEKQEGLDINTIYNAFHTDDITLINQLCDAEVYAVLWRVSQYRNSWKGHSGISSDAVYTDHANELAAELSKLQARLKDLYEKVRLVRPIDFRKSQGEITNRVEVLTGSNAIFKKDTIRGEVLDDAYLYLQIIDTGEVIELPPFFVMRNSPAEFKNACYFYSRLEGSNSRYVSYHFESKPEDIEEGGRAFDVIKSILSK